MWWSATFWFFKGQEARTLIRMLYKCNPEYPHYPHPCLSHWQSTHETRSAKMPGTKVRFPVLSRLSAPSGQLVQRSLSAISVLLPFISLTSHAFPCTSQESLKINWILLRLFLIIIQFPVPNIFYFGLFHLSLSFQVFLAGTPSSGLTCVFSKCHKTSFVWVCLSKLQVDHQRSYNFWWASRFMAMPNPQK